MAVRIHRQFEVQAPAGAAWNYLADVVRWLTGPIGPLVSCRLRGEFRNIGTPSGHLLCGLGGIDRYKVLCGRSLAVAEIVGLQPLAVERLGC